MNAQGMRPGIILLREGTDTSQVRSLSVSLSDSQYVISQHTIPYLWTFQPTHISSAFTLLEYIYLTGNTTAHFEH